MKNYQYDCISPNALQIWISNIYFLLPDPSFVLPDPRASQEFSTPPAYSRKMAARSWPDPGTLHGGSRRSGPDFIGLGPGRLLGLALPGPRRAWELCASGPGARCARSWAYFCRYVRRRRSAHVSVRGALCIRARSSASGPGARVTVLYASGPSPVCALGVYSVWGLVVSFPALSKSNPGALPPIQPAGPQLRAACHPSVAQKSGLVELRRL